MFYYAAKVLISALLIVIISEVSKRNSLIGAIFASVPLVSVLAICWLYLDTHNTRAVAYLATDVFWMVIPSLIFFIVLPIMLKHKINFSISLISSLAAMTLGYFIMLKVLKLVGIK
jgi:hypothetical protein